MSEIPTQEELYDYRGERYRMHSAGDDYVRLSVAGVVSAERFPDALEFGEDPTDPWVKLPIGVLGSAYVQRARGRWRGAPVLIVETIRSGVRRGRVRISYAGTRPDEAVAAGFSGNQYDGWSQTVDPSEVEDIAVEVTEYPRKRS